MLGQTPFYAESGGQVGDTGTLHFGEEVIHVTDTKKENNLTIHFADKLPAQPTASVKAAVAKEKRRTQSVITLLPTYCTPHCGRYSVPTWHRKAPW